MKILTIYLVSIFFLTGCSNFTFNAAMCDQIASDPHATMPEECRNYVEEEADKAFHNTKHERDENTEDLVEFNKNDKDEK